MKILNIKLIASIFCAGFLMTSCNDDDDFGTQPTPPDFTGTFTQVDYMGRPGINTVLNGTDALKNQHNKTIPSQLGATFQQPFQDRLEALHDAYATALSLDPAAVNYQPNILGDILNGPTKDGFTDNPVTAQVLTTVLATDVLEVAPNAPTTYFNPGSGAPNYTDAVGLTGRKLTDDVIDVSLILLFGGGDGARFNGTGGNPQLVTDGVAITATPGTIFPYLANPE